MILRKNHISFKSNGHLESGQALILLILFLPILGVLLIKTNLHIHMLIFYKKTQMDCRTATYKAQKRIKSSFVKIMKLNPKAKKLRSEKIKAQILLMSPEPLTKAKALADIIEITAQQFVLRAQQEILILSAKAQAFQELLPFKAQPNIKAQIENIPFGLKKVPFFSISPSYVPDSQLKVRQKIWIKWSRKIKTHHMEAQCGSFIDYQNKSFQIKYAYPDTSLLNLSLF